MGSDRQPLLRLPGGRFAVDRWRDYPRLLLAGALLLGVAPPIMELTARWGRDSARGRAERAWARAAAKLLDLEVRVDGTKHLDDGGPFIVVPLHEGFADAVALLHLPLDLRFVARRELRGWALLGRYLGASRQLVVDPESPVTAYRRLLRSAPQELGRGRSLVIFPQGTILGIEAAFTGAAFRIAAKTGARVLPVVLAGSHRVWDHPYSPTVRFHQTVRLSVLAPVDPDDAVASARELEREMKSRALSGVPLPRRFVPERDGWWDGYRYRIDPDFPELARRVDAHRGRADAER